MSDNPLPPINPIEKTIDAVASAGTTVAEVLVEKSAEAEVPALATPGLKQIFESFVNWLFGLAGKTGQLALTFTINRAQANSEQTALDVANKAVIAALATGDSNAIASAEANFQKAQSAAANSGGTAIPQ